eukprot:1390482-Rhodomonas_salina.1
MEIYRGVEETETEGQRDRHRQTASLADFTFAVSETPACAAPTRMEASGSAKRGPVASFTQSARESCIVPQDVR